MSTAHVSARGCGLDVPVLLTAEQAAVMCGLGRSTWWRLLSSGKTPKPVKIGGAVRWKREEILDWVDANCPTWTRWEEIKRSR